jgi:hypothetical protein
MTPSPAKAVSRCDQFNFHQQTSNFGRVPHVCTGVVGALELVSYFPAVLETTYEARTRSGAHATPRSPDTLHETSSTWVEEKGRSSSYVFVRTGATDE